MQLTIDHTFSEPKRNGECYWVYRDGKHVCEELSIPDPHSYRWTPSTIAHEIAHATGRSVYVQGRKKGQGIFYWEVQAWAQAIEWLPLSEINISEIAGSLGSYRKQAGGQVYVDKAIKQLKQQIRRKKGQTKC